MMVKLYPPGRLHKLLLILSMALLLGCYTFTGSTLPLHLKTININPVVDNTLNPVFAENLTRGISDGFESSSSLRYVNQNPHCELITILKTYSHEAYNTSGSDVTEYRIDIVLEVVFHDRVKDKILFKEENMPGFGTYSILKGETESIGQTTTINNIVEIILSNTVSGW